MNLEFAAIHYRTIRDRLRAEDPSIDEQTLADTVEGLTDLHEVLAAIVRAALADEALAAGLKGRIAEMQGRLERLQDRAAKRRQIAKDVMVELDLKKLAAPDFTVSVRPGMPALVVLNEDAVPSVYWQPSEPRLKRQQLASDLKQGTEIAGGHPVQSRARPEREDTVMAFSAKQVQALRRQPNRSHIRIREANGRELTYLEGWYAISEANRIFGFDGWSRETVDSRCVLTRENRGSFLAVYIARVRVTVQADGTTIIREGHGTGEGRGSSPGEVHDVALKAAETDATKRALTTFGKPFGLELYRSDRRPRSAGDAPPTMRRVHAPPLADPKIADLKDGKPHPDDLTPIPRPSTYYGRERFHQTQEVRSALMKETARKAELAAKQTEQAELTFTEPKRLRDKAHLNYVASQPCLICGRQPSDPHHLRFAQPRAIGRKVSDEFTVPLCRSHHRNLHQTGDEPDWWNKFRIEPLAIARRLWETTHPECATNRTTTSDSNVSSHHPDRGDEADNADDKTKPISVSSP